MDLDAAKKAAAKKKMPILLNFTGSDWCGLAKLMESRVFSKPRWLVFAKHELLLAVVDFPKNENIVPEKYVQRNNELKDKHKVETFPTYILLDDDGETVLGRLAAGEDKTADGFISELQPLLRYRTNEVASYMEDLLPGDKTAYAGLVAQIAECRATIREQQQRIAEAHGRIEESRKRVTKLKDEAAEFRAFRLQGAKLKQYRELKSLLQEATKELETWMKTNPRKTPENEKIYAEMKAQIDSLTSRLSEY